MESYFMPNEDGSDMELITKKVNASNYINAPANPEKEKRVAEEREMADLFMAKAQSGKAFKDTFGQFNYKLSYEDSLLNFARGSNGQLIQPDIRTQNDVE